MTLEPQPLCNNIEIAIQLDPAQLPNPDADLRYVLPGRLVERWPELFSEDGYGYGEVSERMTVFLTTSDVGAAVPRVIELLQGEAILGNRLSECGVIVAVSDLDHSEDASSYRVVFPPAARFSLE